MTSTYDAAAFAAQTLSSPSALAAVIDHTLLKPDATREQVLKIAREAAAYRFACAMVNPVWTSLVASELAGTGIPVGVVVGFPLGANLTSTKREETAVLLQLGAKEIDMVLNIGQLKSGDTTSIARDIEAIVEISHDAGAIVKVILETCLLTNEEKHTASEIACAAGVDFLKTSTGFSVHGATAEDVALLRGVAGTRHGVKASGGIRTLADAETMLRAGANRIGASASVAIVEALKSGDTKPASPQGTSSY